MSKYDNINFDIINDKELLKLFGELQQVYQKRIVLSGFRQAAKPIIQGAKNNFNARKKNKSLTNYADLNSSFKVEERKAKDVIGVKVGVKYVDKSGRKNWYKYRWIEWGTNDRTTTGKGKSIFTKSSKKRFTGKIEPTHFFYDAVEAHKDQVQENINKSIVEQLEKTVKKFEKN